MENNMSANFLQNFKLKVHESDGSEFENLFSKVMSYHSPGFDKVKPYGNTGDRGNDGWVYDKGIYYQVYAPENLNLPSNKKTSTEKMEEDFDKLYTHWNNISPICEFYFVVNDRYRGIPLHLYSKMKEIKDKYNLNKANVIGATTIERYFSQLSDEQKNYICGQSTTSSFLTEKELIRQIKTGLHLSLWDGISENLISMSMRSDFVDDFYYIANKIKTTQMPGRLLKLDASIVQLSEHAFLLCNHLTDLNFTNEINGSWTRDMSWKRVWLEQDKYDKKYESYENWRRELFRLHHNLAHSLNIFSKEVRMSIDSDFLMGAIFGVNDSSGQYNNLRSMYLIPDSFCSDYRELFQLP